MSKTNVGFIGTEQWYLENAGPEKRKNLLLDAINRGVHNLRTTQQPA